MKTADKNTREPLFHVVKRDALPWHKAMLIRVLTVVVALLFVSLLSVLLAAVHYVIFGLLASLQDIPWEATLLLDECFLQALLTPLLWWAASSLRMRLKHEA